MSCYRQVIAVTIVSISLFYLWSRYCRKKKSSQYLSNQKSNNQGSPSSTTKKGKHEKVQTSVVEISESADSLLASSNLNVIPVLPASLDVFAKKVLSQKAAQGSEEIKKVSGSTHPVQIDPVTKTHQSHEIPSYIVEEDTPCPIISIRASENNLTVPPQPLDFNVHGSDARCSPVLENCSSLSYNSAEFDKKVLNFVPDFTSKEDIKTELFRESLPILLSSALKNAPMATAYTKPQFAFSELTIAEASECTIPTQVSMNLGNVEKAEFQIISNPEVFTQPGNDIQQKMSKSPNVIQDSDTSINAEAISDLSCDALNPTTDGAMGCVLNAEPFVESTGIQLTFSTDTQLEEGENIDGPQSNASVSATVIFEESGKVVTSAELSQSPIIDTAVVNEEELASNGQRETSNPEVPVEPIAVLEEVALITKQLDIRAEASKSVEVSEFQVTTSNYKVPLIPSGIFNDPENDIVEDSPEMLNGTLIHRVLVPSDLLAKAADEEVWTQSISVPACMGGVLIGRYGKNVRELRTDLKAEMTLNVNPESQNFLFLKISCPVENKDSVIDWVNKRLSAKPSQTAIGNPNQLQRTLPLGQVADVMIRSLYMQKELFVTIVDAEYDRYLEMQKELDADYSTLNSSRMQLYEPVTSGTIAVLPHQCGFARVVILTIVAVVPRRALCFMLDHGTFVISPVADLRKIKAKYMRVSFQAIHVSWAHARPAFSDTPDLHILRTFFDDRQISVFPVRMETCCRPSTVFLERLPAASPNGSPAYRDILSSASQCNLFYIAPLFISRSRQLLVNRTNTPYYACPYSSISYESCVYYAVDADIQQSEQEQVHSRRHEQTQQNQNRQRQQGGGGGSSHAENRARRFDYNNCNSGSGGGYKNNQLPSTIDHNEGTGHRQSNRRFRRNGPNRDGHQQNRQRNNKHQQSNVPANTSK